MLLVIYSYLLLYILKLNNLIQWDIMPLIPLFLIFITLSNEVNASELDVKPFRIVNKKQHMSLCMQKAVTLHSGNVIKQSIIDKDQHFLVEYEIKTRNEFGLSLVI